MSSNASRLLLGGFYDTILVRFVGEIGIKSEKVRRRLINRLATCIKNQLERKRILGLSISITHARLFLSIKDPSSVEAVHEILQRIPGIHSFSYCAVLQLDLERVHERAVSLARLLFQEAASFAVRVTRDGTHEFSSQSLARDVGSTILDSLSDMHPRVDLTTPAVTIYIEVRDTTVLLYHEKHDGFGGMPRDVSSPVLGCIGLAPASWEACGLVIKRGANLHPVFLHRIGLMDAHASTTIDTKALAEALNADPGIVSQVFQLLDMQEENLVRITIVPITKEIDEWLAHEHVSSNSRAVAAVLGLMIPALVHARVLSHSAGRPRKAMDFKAIVSEYAPHPFAESSPGALEWIQTLGTAVETMMPAGLPALPILFPLIPGRMATDDRAVIPSSNAMFTRDDKILFDLLRRPSTRDELSILLRRAVDQQRVLQFDMINRRFLSR
ncbi:MAG: THUMP domain-containing protein [Candidatus Sigynarchaeum springense]